MGVSRLFGIVEPGDSLETLVSQMNQVGRKKAAEYDNPSLPFTVATYVTTINVNVPRATTESSREFDKRKREWFFAQLRNILFDIARVRPAGLYEALMRCLTHSTALSEGERKLFKHANPEAVAFGVQLLSENKDDDALQNILTQPNADELLEDYLRDNGFSVGNRPSQR